MTATHDLRSALLAGLTAAVALALTPTAAARPQGSGAAPPPKREVRAVWITTVNGLDWPKSTDAAEQRAALERMVDSLARAKFNTIFFQVRGRGDAMYRSRYEPWSPLLAGALGKDPGWDPLKFICNAAHRRGMELHAWFNTFLIKSSRLETPETTPRHIVLQHPEWLRNIDGEYWLDPGIPDVRKFLVETAVDLVASYDVDGIQFDFVRYPAKPFADDATFKKYGGKRSRDDWRRENVTAFVREAYDRIHKAKRYVKVGSAPIGIYANFGNVKGLQSYYELYQDSRLWLREGIHDYLVPQVYWSLGDQRGDPDFAAVASEWASQRFRRHLYLGIGAYKADVHAQLPALIDIGRMLGVSGFSFFRYENIADIMEMGGKFAAYANVPAMPWIDSLPPDAPSGFRLAAESRDGGGNAVTLTWELSPRDSGRIACLDIYRSPRLPLDTQNPANILAVVAAATTSFADTIRHPGAARYFYAVSAVSRAGLESPAAVPQSLTIPEVIALAAPHAQGNRLGACFRRPSDPVAYIPYELRQAGPVALKILDPSDGEVMSIVNGVQEAGNYVAAADLSSLAAGNYTCVLTAGSFTERKSFSVGR